MNLSIGMPASLGSPNHLVSITFEHGQVGSLGGIWGTPPRIRTGSSEKYLCWGMEEGGRGGDMSFLDKVARIRAELLGAACDMPPAQVVAVALPLMGIVPEPSWALPQMVDAIMTAMTGSSSTSRAAPTAPATAPVTAPATAPAEPLSTAPAASKKAAGKLRRQAARPNLAAPRSRWRRR